jgi:enoyl-CoA hydratase/carnithine racemase
MPARILRRTFTVSDAISGIRYEVVDRVATITIARAARRNALDCDAWRAMKSLALTIAADASIRVAVLQGDGAHFCAGADLVELSEHIEDADWMLANQSAVGDALDAVAAIPQPVVARVQGSAFGGGMALCVSADFVLAASDARFAITPAKLGLSYRLVDCARVVECVGARRARELLLAARELDALTACDWGVVTRVVGATDLRRESDELVARLKSLSGVSHRAIKHNLMRIRAGQAVDDAATQTAFANAFGAADFRGAATAFIDKRPAVFE